MAIWGQLAWLPSTFLALLSMQSAQASPSDTSISLVSRDSNPGYFINPPVWDRLYNYKDDPLYHVDDILNITWSTDWPNVDLILCQPALDGSWGSTRLRANFTQRWFSWKVSESDVVVHAGPVGPIFFFQITPPNTQNPFVNSHYFNVTKPEPGSSPTSINPPGSSPASPSSSASPKNLTSSTNSTSSPNSNSNTSSSSPTPSESPGDTGSLSAGSVAAIAVSVGLAAGVCTAALTWWLCVSRRRKRQAALNAARKKDHSTLISDGSTVDLEIRPPVEMPAIDKIGEFEGDRRIAVWEMAINERPIELPTWEGRESRLADRDGVDPGLAGDKPDGEDPGTRHSTATYSSSYTELDIPVSAVDSLAVSTTTRDFPVSPLTPYMQQQAGRHSRRESQWSAVSADEERSASSHWSGPSQQRAAADQNGNGLPLPPNWPLR